MSAFQTSSYDKEEKYEVRTMTARAFKASKLLCCGSDNSSGYLSQVKHPKMLEEENGKYIKINKVFHQMRRVAVGRQVVKSFFFFNPLFKTYCHL